MGSSESLMSNMKGLAAQFGLSIPLQGNGTDVYSPVMYPTIIKSRAISNELLVRKFDTHKYGTQKQLLQILTYGNDEPEFSIDTLMIMGAEFLQDMIMVKIDNKTPVITIALSSTEP